MRSARLAACVSVLLAFGACSSSSKSSLDGAVGGTPDAAAVGGSGGSTGAAGSTGTGGSIGGTSTGGGTGLGGTLSSTAAGGRGGSAGATTGTTGGGSTSGPDAGMGGTGGSPRLDAGASSGLDASTQIDTPVSKPDGAEAGEDASRAEASTDDGGALGLNFCRTTSTGCQCTTVATGEPAISACSKASLGADTARCCSKAGAHCSCDSIACVADTSTGRCKCDFAALLSSLPPTYSKVAECPAPASELKCCLHAAEGYCDCKQQTCSAGSTEVTTCTPAQLSVCASGEQAVASCK
jgi:hypothetical protein